MTAWGPEAPLGLPGEGIVEPATGPPTCPACAAPVAPGERYCEACGADLGPPAPAPAGGPRDHVTEQPAAWVGAVSDRGLRHSRNEDAVALDAGSEQSGHAVLVVCDGVSSSTGSDVASLAAARAARDVLSESTARVVETGPSRVAAITEALARAADAARAAVIAHTTAGPGNPASCTFVAAIVNGPLLVAGWVGDSRAYWLPDAGDPRLLTVDDTFAAEAIAQGVPRAVAESAPQAHAITRWLGRDAPDRGPRTESVDLDGPGWVLVCSDGMWNYCSAPRDLAALVASTCATSGPEPLRLAGALVDWANAQGGQDNITVALARAGPALHRDPTPRTTEPSAAGAMLPTSHREEVPPDGHVLR